MKMMKRAISFIAMLAMLVSMFSVCVVPTLAADSTSYESLLNNALVVDPDWKDANVGDSVTVVYQGNTITESFDNTMHFATYAAAWEYAQSKGIAKPVILLNAGTYTETIEIAGAVTLLGSDFGVDPNVKSAAKDVAWTLNPARSYTDDSLETLIKGNIVVRVSASKSDLTFDGLTFVDGGAVIDHERDANASEFTLKNCLFNNAGNAKSEFYGLYLRSPNHKRTLRLENLYITNQNHEKVANADGFYNSPNVGFISPFFVELIAENVAYIENKVGFLASTWFAKGDAPVIDINNSCFYNADAATPVGHIISMDNASVNFDFGFTAKEGQHYSDIQVSKDAAQRPSSTLKVTNSVFYNASATESVYDPTVLGGVIHYEFVSSSSVLNLQNNYFYAPNGTSVLDNEYLINATQTDLTSAQVIKNNLLFGPYKVPTLTGSSEGTYIDMTGNYFARTDGSIVNTPSYMSEEDHRLIRDYIWVNSEMTIDNEGWNLTAGKWPLVWVDNDYYTIDLSVYTEGDVTAACPVTFTSNSATASVQLYKNAVLDADGVPLSVTDPVDKIDASILTDNKYAVTTLYLQVTDPTYPSFAPIYTISVQNCGDVNDMKNFSDVFPGYLMVHPNAGELSAGQMMPYRWRDQVYKFYVGTDLFETAEKAIAYGYKKGDECPTVCIPAGEYKSELLIPGSCTILGEQHGINPNVKPYDTLTQENFDSSAWILNPKRSDAAKETTFYAPIRVIKAADDYVITIDGIKMAEGCSYVDDFSRNGDNITILKNIYARNAGGGTDRNGADNIALFNFKKPFGQVTDYCSFYLYDSRVDVLDSFDCFTPYFERFVVDGLFYGNTKNGAYFINGMQSRNIPDPYYSITNCYWYKNTENKSIYSFTTNDIGGSQTSKENIIYNIDGNVFHDGFQSGWGSMEFWWTGTNMSVYLTNNTLKGPDAGGFIAQTAGGVRYKGTSGDENCSDMFIMKGNRFITNHKVPMTNGVGVGTKYDFSGNYWSPSISSGGLTPETLNKVDENGTGTYTLEETTRWKIDYTYLDWDMTIRSDAASSNSIEYQFTKGMFGTGTHGVETVGGVEMDVYRDRVPVDCSTYNIPVVKGEFNSMKFYTDATLYDEVKTLELTEAVNRFYGAVYTMDGTSNKVFMLEIERDPGTEADVIYYDGGLIDRVNKEIHVTWEDKATNRTYNLGNRTKELAYGATAAFYKDAECTQKATTISLTGSNKFGTAYMKITSEDGLATAVYKINVSKKKANAAEVACIPRITGMKAMDGNVYQVTITGDDTSYNFKPESHFGGSVTVMNGENVLLPKSDGTYDANFGTADTFTLKAIATSGNGAATAEYTLNFVRKIDTSSCDVVSVDNATKISSGFLMNIGLSSIIDEIKVETTPGATYGVYEDYFCNNPVGTKDISMDGLDSKVFYIKVTSGDGNSSKTVRLLVNSSATTRKYAEVTTKIGDVTYTAVPTGKHSFALYLPAGVKEVNLSGLITKAKDDSGKVTFFADAGRKINLGFTPTITLNQKETLVYMISPETTYLAPMGRIEGDAKLLEKKTVLTIISDRESVDYSDKAQIANHWAAPYVEYLNDGKTGLFMGDQNKALNINANITRYELAVLTTRVLGLDVNKYANTELKFADSVVDWALPSVRAAVGAGLVNGSLDVATNTVSFKGDDYATREEVMKIVVAACLVNDGVTIDGAAYYKRYNNTVDMDYPTNTFADEDAVSEWAVPYVHLAVGKYKLVNGSAENGKLYLYPRNNITRAEVIKMIACYKGY